MATTINTQTAVSDAVANASFLKKSGWTFNAIGIVAFIVGLLIGVSGIWITGCAGITAGCYLLFKSHQQLETVRSEASTTAPSATKK